MTLYRLLVFFSLTSAFTTGGIALSHPSPEGGGERVVTPPSGELRDAFDLAPHYSKTTTVEGFPIVGSAKVNDFALLEAAYWIGMMLDGRNDVRQALISERVRFGIMATDEFTTDLPEHSDLTPSAYWDKRARGLGSTPHRPCVSCGEENLLRYRGDPYDEESILIHEFAHAFHLQGLNVATPDWEAALIDCYNRAMKEGLWKGTYASTNKEEYWAEGVQSFFDTNREDDHDHNHVNTRSELREHDPRLHDLISETFANVDWRYTRPETHIGAGHLKGYSPATAPIFQWPKRVLDAFAAHEKSERNLPQIKPLALDRLPTARSPGSRESTEILVRNVTGQPARLFWVDFEGKRQAHGWIRNGWDKSCNTFVGHLFLIADKDDRPLALFAATAARARFTLE